MSGVPAPASIQAILRDLFANEHYKHKCVEEIATFSLLRLSKCQKEKLTYPCGFKPLNLFLLTQTDRYESECKRETKLAVISFAKKECSKFIYGFYFNLADQERFHVRRLWDDCHRVELCDKATFTFDKYVEVYNCVKGTTVILGNSTEPVYSTLQYADEEHYFYEELTAEGIKEPRLKKTELCGLSKNIALYLERREKHC